MKYTRGSEWRKWDLHIHAPSKYTCAKTDCYEGETLEDKQKKFIDELSKIKDVKVLGITDYFSLEGYKHVISKKEELSNFDLILPNIELRISPVTGDNRKINLHIIPNTDILEIEDIERFLHKFEITSNKYTCSERHLIEYGKFLGETTSKEASFLKGLNEFVITYEKLFEVINSESSLFKENILIGVSNNSTDGASGIKDISGIRQIIYSGVDFIFSGQPSDRDYFLGYKADSKEKILEKYGNLIPCIHGSDYHGGKNKKMPCVPDKNRFCWIKADTTFEGLKQIIFEPEDRVKIQENKPEDKSGYQIIDSISLTGESWNQEINLNSNLTAIIGGRSTGKSTLLASIAKKIGVEEENIDNEKKEFLEALAKDIAIKWKDSEEGTERDIDFFWQNYMYNIAKDREKRDELVKDIIRNRDENSLIQDYHKFYEENKDSIESNINSLFKVNNGLKKEIKELKETGDKAGISKEIEKLEKELKSFNNTEENASNILEEYSKLTEKMSMLKDEIKKIKQDSEELHIQKDKDIFNGDVIYRLNALSDDIRKKMTKYYEKLKAETQNKWSNQIDLEIKELNLTVSEKEEEIKKINLDVNFTKGKKMIEENKAFDEIQQKIKKEKEKLRIIEEIEKKISTQKEQILNLKKEIIKAHTEYGNKLKELKDKFIIESDGIRFNIDMKFLNKELEEFLKERLNLQGKEIQEYISNFSNDLKDNPEEKIEEFLNKSLYQEFNLKKEYKNKESLIVSELISESWYKISFDLIYQNDGLNQMSQGKQAFVILKLLLEFSNKKCPILIDQPEDSLDNRAIYNELVQYIKSKKKERQIILVTHNPNIVVGADAEQVIVANQHGENAKNNSDIKFQYISGSLENSKQYDSGNEIVLESQGIREHVCDILEGGDVAFKKRERKYNLK